MADEEFMFGDLFATVRVQDLPASREVVAVERQENGTWRVCGSAIANTDGIAELGIEGSKASRVYAFAIDHWGEHFTPNRTVAYGDIIRPSVFLGWLYRVTAPGVLPGEEPVWWNSTPGMPRPVGSAMAQAEMYFQPIAHGPVDIEWEDKQEGDPHWDKVVALLHFDDEADPWKDDTEKIWTPTGIVELGLGKWGKSVGSFVNSNDKYLRSPNTDGVFNLPGQFTFECWFQHTNTGAPYRNIFLGGSSSFIGGLAVTVNNKSSISVDEMYGQNVLSAPFTIEDAWYFLAVTRDIDNIIRIFVDGVLISQALSTSSFSFSPSGHAHILNHHAGSGSVGRVDELRITKGVARYTANFTPPTEPFPNFKRL